MIHNAYCTCLPALSPAYPACLICLKQECRYTKACPAIGRVPTILVLRLSGVGVLGFMGFFPDVWIKLGVIIPLHMLRTAIVRSAAPLEKSILMDYVPKASLCCGCLLFLLTMH